MEQAEKHQENRQQSEGDDDGEAAISGLLEFKLAAPHDVVFWGKINLLGDELFGISNKGTGITPGDIASHREKPVGIFAADLPEASDWFNFVFQEIRKHNIRTIRFFNQQIVDGFDAVAVIFIVSDENAESFIAFEDLA